MTAADRVLALLPQLHYDATNDELLARLVRAWTSGLERSADVAYGSDDAPGPWVILSDPARAPLWALPHAALYTGGSMPPRLAGENDTAYLARAREAVVRPQGMLRGAHSALVAALQTHLTGSRYVRVVEFVDNDAWKLAARVRDDEAPDVAALQLAANAPNAVPAGMTVQIVVSTGAVWDEQAATWDATAQPWNET